MQLVGCKLALAEAQEQQVLTAKENATLREVNGDLMARLQQARAALGEVAAAQQVAEAGRLQAPGPAFGPASVLARGA